MCAGARHVNMMDIVDEVVGMTEMAVDKNGRHLVNSNVMMINSMCAGKLPMVLGDSYKITQLLYNLVTNAAKFTMAGSIQISAREDLHRSVGGRWFGLRGPDEPHVECSGLAPFC